jgi:hypothetical protein
MTGLIEIKLNQDFNDNILPKIDALAAEQNKTRNDVIRDILYASSNYKPRPRSPENANKVLIEQYERPMQKRRIWVAVDTVYLDAFYQYVLTLPGMERNYNSYLHQILYHHFGMEVPNSGSAEIPTMQPFDLSNPPRVQRIKLSGLQKQTEDYCPS